MSQLYTTTGTQDPITGVKTQTYTTSADPSTPSLASLSNNNGVVSPVTSISSAAGEKLNADNAKAISDAKTGISTTLSNVATAKANAAAPKVQSDADLLAKIEAAPKTQQQIDADTAHDAMIAGYDASITANDEANVATKSQLLAQYQQQRTQLEALAKNANAIVTRAGQTAGGDRYTPEINVGIVTAQANDGLQKLQDLDSKYTAAVAAADAAMRSGDATIANQKLKEMYEYKQKAADEIQTQLKNAITTNKAINDKVIQSSRDSAVADLLSQGVTDPKQILDYLNVDDQGNTVGDFTADEINKTLKALAPAGDVTKLTGSLGEYYKLVQDNVPLPPSIAALPKDQQPFAYVKYKADLAKATPTPKAPKAAKAPKTTTITPTYRRHLLNTGGLSDTDLNNLERDISTHGLPAVLNNPDSGLSDLQKNFLRENYAGKAATDAALDFGS